jgi:effector-binding domain-containing protein
VNSYTIERRTIAPQDTAVEYATLPAAEIPPFLARAYAEVASYLQRKGAGPAGMPFARYHRLGEERFEVEAGFPASTPVGGEGEVEPSELPGGVVAVTVHVGPYETMAPAYAALAAWITEHGGTPVGDAWEVYHDDPGSQPDSSKWRTEIIQPVRL